jgi:hypothetical protein
MNAFDPVAALRKEVDAAKQEFHMALSFYETWKPAAYDKDLQKRMGVSFATQTFLVVRLALRGDAARIDATLGQGFEGCQDQGVHRRRSPRPIRRPETPALEALKASDSC